MHSGIKVFQCKTTKQEEIKKKQQAFTKINEKLEVKNWMFQIKQLPKKQPLVRDEFLKFARVAYLSTCFTKNLRLNTQTISISYSCCSYLPIHMVRVLKNI